ncbi:MAG: DUF167 domain-containing protein [Candidatus Eisenbacteria bacterium]|uniref:UPF0235 protein E6K76_10515 n=1 Tax=Eiseniibacteriota bacterium TaxID=2212470 RepID=A0A538T1G1_UNCEI|nr:MAG: DUF167 domain-containing protein [Candidatus Eisenbacteria bacterium]
MRLKLRVTPKSRANEVAGVRADGALLVRVTTAPEDGRANEAVIRLLSETLGLPRGAIRLVGGASSREKWVELDGIDEAEVRRRLRT